MPQPEVRCFHVDGHLGYMVLNIRVARFLLRVEIAYSEIISRFRRAQERGCIVGNETGLPALFEVLSRVPDQMRFGYECPLESHEVTDCRPHTDRVPPGPIDSHRRV